MRRAARVLLAVVLIAGTILAVGYGAAAYRARRADQDWAASSRSMEDFAAAHPVRKASRAALELDVQARRLGIALISRDGDGPSRTAVLLELLRFIGTLQRASAQTADAPPAAIRDFLARNARVADAIEGHLVAPAAIEWEQDIRDPASPMPSFIGHRHLHNVLLARAFEADRAGRRDAAARSLEAAWRLNGTLRERPDLLSQLLAMGMATGMHGVLRHVGAVPEAWAGRLRDGYRDGVLRSLQHEAYVLSRPARQFRGIFDMEGLLEVRPLPDGPAAFLGRLLTAPYLSLSLSSFSEGMRRSTESLQGSDLCADTDRLGEELEQGLPRWNVIGRKIGPSLVRAWGSAAYTTLDAELTLLAREARADTPGTWPRASEVCKGLWWLREDGDGGIEVRAASDPLPRQKPSPSWSFTSARPGPS